MDDKTRQQITWLIIAALVMAVIVVAVHRRTEVDRLLHTISVDRPAAQIEAVTRLIEKQKLAEALEDQPRWVQDRAVAAAELVGSEEALFQLVAAKSVVDEPVIAEIDAYLTSVGELAIGPLVLALQDKDAAVRGGASGPLKTIGAPAVDSLMPLIDVYDDGVRGLVASTLGGIGEPAIKPLLRVMKQDEPGVDQGPAAFRRAKSAAEAAFKAMGEVALDPVINELIEDEDPDVRLVAAGILGSVASGLEEDVAKKVIPPLIKRLQSDPAFAVRRRAATALGSLGDTALNNGALQPLINALGDSRAEVRAAVAVALGTLGDPAAAGPLVHLLMTNRMGATAEIAQALEKIGHPAIPALREAVSHPDTEVRLVTVQTIAAIGGPDAVPLLGAALTDPDTKVRRAAADALRSLADARVLEQLAHALGDSEATVYHAARDALERIGAPAVPVLIRSLGSPNPRVAYMAQQALAQIGAPAIPALINELRAAGGGEKARWVALALGTIGEEAVDPAIALLQDVTAPEPARAAAAEALGVTGSFSATKTLSEAAKKAPVVVRKTAIRALGKIGDPSATEVLVAALTDPAREVREVAMVVLKNWRFGDVDKELQKILNADDADAARRAAIILADHSPAASSELIRAVGVTQQEGVGESEQVRKLLEETIADPGVGAALRHDALTAITYVGNADSLDVLAPLLVEGGEFAHTAAKAVGRIGQRLAHLATEEQESPGAIRATELLLKVFDTARDDQTRFIAATGLAVMGGAPVPYLIDRITKGPDQMRPWFAAILGAIGKPASDPVLDARGREQDPNIRNWFAVALTLIGDAQALDLIRQLPEEEQPDPERVKAGREVLTRLQELL